MPVLTGICSLRSHNPLCYSRRALIMALGQTLEVFRGIQIDSNQISIR